MDERSAQDVTCLEAFETAQPAAPTWSDDDRAWADRVALEAADAEKDAGGFVAQRARHALQRLAPREPLLAKILAAPVRPLAWLPLLAAIAFAVGLVADSIGAGQRINLLAPPLWGVLAWNVVVYVLLLVLPVWCAVRRRTRAGLEYRPGPIVRGIESLLRQRRRLPALAAGGSAYALRRCAALWFERSRGLAVLRSEALLHACAAVLALGLVAGLYARGLVLDYRVTWESTFLDADTAHALVATLLSPASWLTGIAVPDAAAFAAMRSASGQPGTGAPAAAWIHLLATTLVVAVIVPRLLLALAAAALARARSRRFALPLGAPYFQRLARLQRGATAEVAVYPYACTLSAQAALALRALLAEAFGPRVAPWIAPAVAFGGEDDAVPAPPAATTHAIVLFDLSATPEAEHHGRFVKHIGAALPAGAVLAVLLEEGAFARRFAHLAERLAQRREAWRRWAEPLAAAPLGVDLEAAAGPAAVAPSLRSAFALPVAAP
ncbi:MAG: DUF2868 domain-containing protein, partial [Caldimonas sp.]